MKPKTDRTMSDIIKHTEDHIPAPDRDRTGHVPTVGDIYLYESTHYPQIIRLTSVTSWQRMTFYNYDWYDFIKGEWVTIDDNKVSTDNLKSYYVLLLDDFDEVMAMARAAVGGDMKALDVFGKKEEETVSMELVASRPAEQVLALTEAAERLQDKVETVKVMMQMIVESIRSDMQRRVRALENRLSDIKDYVRDLQRVITVMNLYTGQGVDVTVVTDGEPAAPGTPIHIRQRILYMDEEYLASAEWGGIDCNDLGLFCDWMRKPANRDIICPEERCIVAMKPKRFDKHYSGDAYTNALENQWNHHTMVFFRDGERLLLIDSEDLELHGTAIPYSDQADRFEKRYQEIMKERSFQESNLKQLKDESERLGYMYTKYLTFLQGVVDSGKVFDLSAGRPDFAKGDGVVFIHDAENAIGTGEDWYAFQKRLNAGIRRGTRVVFFPYGQDEHGYRVKSGMPNRYYYHEANAPKPPKAGVYNVDYPTKTKHVKDEDGHWKKVTGKGDGLALFYTPAKPWKFDDDPKDRTEAWIYNPWCVINYDALTVEDIDRFMADRTQREHFRRWMPVLQEARKQLLKEKADEDAFVLLMQEEIQRETGNQTYEETVRNAIRWWKTKVIFSRPLRSDDTKAWRMIKKEVLKHN